MVEKNDLIDHLFFEHSRATPVPAPHRVNFQKQSSNLLEKLFLHAALPTDIAQGCRSILKDSILERSTSGPYLRWEPYGVLWRAAGNTGSLIETNASQVPNTTDRGLLDLPFWLAGLRHFGLHRVHTGFQNMRAVLPLMVDW